MTQPYAALFHTRLPPRTTYATPTNTLQRVSVDGPAIAVMTDLRQVMALTVPADASIEFANQRMMAGGVRLLLVVDDDRWITGLITASDILGEKPLQHLQRRGGTFSDVLVQDIMTPQSQLDVLRYQDVLSARVGDVIETLKRFGRQHGLVMEKRADDGEQWVRGIFSATQIGRQLGRHVVPAEIATTFAELEAALVS